MTDSGISLHLLLTMHNINLNRFQPQLRVHVEGKVLKGAKSSGPTGIQYCHLPRTGDNKNPTVVRRRSAHKHSGLVIQCQRQEPPGPVPQRAGLETQAQGDRGAAAAEPQPTLSGRHPAAYLPRSAPVSHTVLVQGPRDYERPASPNPDVNLPAHRKCVSRRRKWRAVAPAAT